MKLKYGLFFIVDAMTKNIKISVINARFSGKSTAWKHNVASSLQGCVE